jgi:mono/diheme cytochrome c family protein
MPSTYGVHGVRNVLLAIGACLLAAGAAAEDPGRAGAPGRQSYRLYCGSCHGPAALGAAAPDLTGLAARFGGTWPARSMAEGIARGRGLARPASDCDRELRAAFPAQVHPSVGRRGTALAIFQYLETIQRVDWAGGSANGQ